MKQFTQQQAAEMYAALEFVQEHCQLYGAGDAAREKIAAALAHADAQPVSAPAADIARAVIADMERPLRIVELNPLDVMEMADALGATLDQEAAQ